MLCVKCGHDNSPGTRYCSKCNAIMIQAAPESTTTSVIDVEEGTEYVSPQKNYECMWLADFADVTMRYANGEVEFDEVKRVYENIKKIVESFDNRELPDFLNELDEWRHAEIGKEYSRQMTYLLTKGFQLMGEGIEVLRGYIDNPESQESLETGLDKVQDGVNQIGLAEELLRLNQQLLEEELNRREMEARAEQFKSKIDGQKGAAEESAEEPAEA